MSYNLAAPSMFSSETGSFSGAGDSGRKDHRTKACRTTRNARVPKVDDGQVVSYVRQLMKGYDMTWDEVVEMLVALHGSLERAVWSNEMGEAEAKERLNRLNAPPDGVEFGAIGRKPKPGEEVTATRLGPNLSIRVWPGDHNDCYAFDFVNGQGQYICTPEDIEIWSMPSGLGMPAPVRSIEASVGFLATPFFNLDINKGKFKPDLNWETYIIPQGTTLRIMQCRHEDCFLAIPSWEMNPANVLVLQPWAPMRD
ncbi:uncharacterized protein LACBIDRAFT_328379 [Laccaria bicolor S238N-H82]|uniref:Predicted protein n=1 Tax=Laccaria bicolor (strain S238N-H82 / ATCC MYA-4686) TaxID=486041 RepID=B0DEP6_LACBS|nr:uncharacterized protein LACBIDRAFT_328379 [Laccaria bicolor S238N-H82]EDR06976.1 predicted protein [Laccaria bicolor S238N-H82]|eukprot:XP_001882349.1 predicted protein [Laccaria bicolor S238N-H82]